MADYAQKKAGRRSFFDAKPGEKNPTQLPKKRAGKAGGNLAAAPKSKTLGKTLFAAKTKKDTRGKNFSEAQVSATLTLEKRKVHVGTATKNNAPDFEKTATRVAGVSILANILLMAFKFFAGIFAHSEAMVSDAIHSASDVFSTLVVIVGVRLSGRAADDDHPYGHERFECVASIVLAMVLAVTGLWIGYSAVTTIVSGEYEDLSTPGVIALVAAAVSILVKEGMYHYTRANAKRIDSGALMADAWHHRTDALSSIGALIGIAGARLGFPVMDSLASLIICLFVVKAAVDIFRDAMDKMVDKACDADTESALADCALRQEGVLGIDTLHTRMFGNKIYVDIEIRADGDKTLWETHDTAERVHNAIEQNFEKVKHIMVHVNPE